MVVQGFPKRRILPISMPGSVQQIHQFGCARVQEDLLSGQRIFVIAEFSVNDEPGEHYMETYEGLIRHILSDEKSLH